MKIQKIVNISFGIIGFSALFYLISDFGFYNLIKDINLMGYKAFFLILTFIPTLICYALAWICVTNFKNNKNIFSLKKIIVFTKLTASSIAWNNLTPFLKIGGEPVKVLMLKGYVSQAQAIISTIIYNIIHLLGTLCSFILISILIPFIFKISEGISAIFFAIAILSVILFLLLLFLPSFWKKIAQKKSKFKKIKKVIDNLTWSLLKTQQYFKKNKGKVIFAIFLETLARFVEGITFYYAFILLQEPISLLTSAFLDASRTLIDTMFFFIPYQVGGREQGILFLMNKVFKEQSSSILSAVLSYRFVEISWTLIGHIIWVKEQYRNQKSYL